MRDRFFTAVLTRELWNRCLILVANVLWLVDGPSSPSRIGCSSELAVRASACSFMLQRSQLGACYQPHRCLLHTFGSYRHFPRMMRACTVRPVEKRAELAGNQHPGPLHRARCNDCSC